MNAPTKPNIEQRVDQYVRLRDHIKKLDDEHKEKMKPFRETLETLNAVLLQHLKQVGADSASTGAGTVYRTERKSASVADKTAFWTYVTTQGLWELIDYKANATAVKDHMDQSGHEVPGVNYNAEFVAGVRRK